MRSHKIFTPMLKFCYNLELCCLWYSIIRVLWRSGIRLNLKLIHNNITFSQAVLKPKSIYIYIYIYLCVCVCVYIYIQISSNLSNDRSKASSKTIPPYSAIYSFLLQLTVSSPVLKVIQQLLTPSSSSSCHFYLPLYLSFNNLLQKTVST